MNIEEKYELYKKAKFAYYNSSEPIMSDEEFDSLEDELIDAGYDPELGYQEISKSDKIKHNLKMLSLGKIKVMDDKMSIETANELFDKYGPGLLSWKYDGLALEAQYKDGYLVALCTRGDGIYGKNVLEKFKHLVPYRINWMRKLDVRFEAVMNERVFEHKYSGKYKHSRNLVAGIFNDIDINDERKFDIEVKVLEIIDVESKKFIQPALINDWFVKNYKGHLNCYSASDIKQFFDECYKNRSNYQYGTDGMVYTSLSQETYEFKGNYPTYATAIKFKPPRLISTITDISWRLSRTGRYIPVIHFQPITVDGRNIKQASGYNLKYLLDNNLCVGQQVQVFLSNDIIPLVRKVS